MKRFFRYVLIVTILIAAACSSRDVASSYAFRTYKENGVSIAVTSGGSKFEDPLFWYEEILTLEQNEDSEESLLFRAYRYLMDEEGRYYVQDGGNNRVAVFDELGIFSHSIGRRGQGPGEFRSVTLLTVMDGYVSVLDSRQQRTSIFDYNGGFIKQVSFKDERIDMDSQVYEGPGDTKILLRHLFHHDFRPKIFSSWCAIVYSADGDTISSFNTEQVHIETLSATVEATTGGYYQGQPYAAYLPGKGIVMSTGVEPVLEWFNLSGDLIQTIRLDIPPETVTIEEKSTVFARLDREIEEAQSPFMESITNEKRRIAEIPETKGYWRRLVVDDAGFIWAQKPYPYYLDEYPERSTFLIISPDGEYLGNTVFPTESGTVSRGYFLSIQRDEETELPSLIVYKIHPAVRGLAYK